MANAGDIEGEEFYDAREHVLPKKPTLNIKKKVFKKPIEKITENIDENIIDKEVVINQVIKKQVINEQAIDNDEDKLTCNANNKRYLEYKFQLFGKRIPDRIDKYCEFYECNNIENIIYFTKNIKEYALNTNIDNKHISKIAKDIYKTKELYFVNPIALIEYTEYESASPKDLLEILDGHHRLGCLKTLFNQYAYENITFTFWVQIYKCSRPNDSKSLELFNKYNVVKPFPIDLDLKNFIVLLIDKLNKQFNKEKFTLIKDTKQHANRPSIGKRDLCDAIEKRIEEQLKTIVNKDLDDINIDTIMEKFINYNNSLANEPITWFNEKNKANTGKITPNIYKKAKDNKCYLGLLNLNDLVVECVNL